MYVGFDDTDIGEDYRMLLRRGSVMRRLALSEHGAWRKAIRRRARADELRIRTWSRAGAPATVWATLPDWSLTQDERRRLAQRISWQRED
jgi:hypothetical protein